MALRAIQRTGLRSPSSTAEPAMRQRTRRFMRCPRGACAAPNSGDWSHAPTVCRALGEDGAILRLLPLKRCAIARTCRLTDVGLSEVAHPTKNGVTPGRGALRAEERARIIKGSAGAPDVTGF